MSAEYYMDWDSEIDATTTDRILLPDKSEAEFIVENFIRMKTQSGSNMAKLILNVGNEHGRTEIHEYLVLQQNTMWKLAQFFKSIGQRGSGETIKPDWNKVTGAKGKCIVRVEEFTSQKGNTFDVNRIDRFLPANGEKEDNLTYDFSS